LTCWNSTTRQTSPSISMCMPFLNWFVLTVSAMRPNLADGHGLLGDRGEHLRAVVGDDDEILDADAADAGEVHAGLDGHDVAGRQRARVLDVQPRRLVHLQAEAVTETVTEERAEAGGLDDVPRDPVDGDAVGARPNRAEPGELSFENDVVGVAQL